MYLVYGEANGNDQQSICIVKNIQADIYPIANCLCICTEYYAKLDLSELTHITCISAIEEAVVVTIQSNLYTSK